LEPQFMIYTIFPHHFWHKNFLRAQTDIIIALKRYSIDKQVCLWIFLRKPDNWSVGVQMWLKTSKLILIAHNSKPKLSNVQESFFECWINWWFKYRRNIMISINIKKWQNQQYLPFYGLSKLLTLPLTLYFGWKWPNSRWLFFKTFLFIIFPDLIYDNQD